MRDFSASPREMLASAWRHRRLIAQMSRREVIGRYRGSMLGIVWSFFNPVVMLAVYTFVFSIVFKARWNSGDESNTEFAIVLFAGMIIFGIFAEGINRAPNLILSNPNYVKKVVFPLEIMPWIALGSSLFHAAVSLGVLLLFYASVKFSLQWTIVFLPFVLLPLTFLTMGLSWFLASLGVYLRDVGQTVGVATTVLMFISPVFYPASSLPEHYRSFLYLNPLTAIIEQARAVLIWGNLPDWSILGTYSIGTFAFACFGFAWFQKTRKGFADVV